MDESKTPRKPLLYYWVIALLVVFLLNALVFPLFSQPQVEQVRYDQFLADLDAGQIKEVELEESQISFKRQDEDKKVYITGRAPDYALVDRLESAGVEYNQVIPKKNSLLMTVLLTWILPFLLLFLLGNFMFRSLQKRMGGGNAMTFGKSNAKVYVAAETGKTFADVAGQEEAKEALRELVDFLNDPEKYQRVGARMPKGALLVGPPGTGKTLLAQAIAGEARVPFFSISGSEFVEMFVGMGAARVRDLFKQAQEKAPCIIFIDEIDTIGKKRDNAMGIGGNDEREQTLNQLLAEMDGFDGSKGVIILAATNRPETLDKALLRPGRFDRRIPVELPDLQGREAVLRVHAKEVQTDGEIDYNAIARATSGASGAELANIINEAALLAVRNGREAVNQQDLEESVETVIAGYQRKGAVISEREKKIIAYHEIGHALVAAKQKHSAPVHKITIIPRTSGALGYTLQLAEEENVLMSKEEAYERIAVCTGGRAAEELVFHTCTSGAANDIEQATKMARAMVTRLGMSEEFDMMALETVTNPYLSGDAMLTCSSQTAAAVDTQVLKLIKEAHRQALTILEENQAQLHQLAQFLLEKETITGEEFMDLLNGKIGLV